MKSDHWFYRIFRDLPWLYFRLLGLPDEQAEGYSFEAAELKDVSMRLDGIFQPRIPGRAYFFLEAQLYKDSEFYPRWLAKILLYLANERVASDWRALVLFGSRSQEPEPPFGVQEWIDSHRLELLYLDELPDFPDTSLEVAVLKLAVSSEADAVDKARALVTAARSTRQRPAERRALLGLIEAFLVSNLPRLTREEIQTMLQLHDIRESAIYQEGKNDGEMEEKRKIVALLREKGKSVQEISELLDLEESAVQALIAPTRRQ